MSSAPAIRAGRSLLLVGGGASAVALARDLVAVF